MYFGKETELPWTRSRPAISGPTQGPKGSEADEAPQKDLLPATSQTQASDPAELHSVQRG